jgi:beta-mannosidase
MVWQDFMFANAMYPGDSAFIENVKNEANFQVKRLSSHPSLAVWCGNNEMDEAWHNWGWTSNYSKQDSAKIWNDYEQLFHSVLPEIVQKICPEISYTSSSPIFGRGNPRSSFEGDNHYWYVWHDGYDFDWYNKVTGRFMSEFGFQSFPSINTIELFDSSARKTIDSEIMIAHQKHPRGNAIIKQYMANYYPVPEDFEDFIYVSQLLQAEGIRTGILAQRRAKPFCMGSLYWQLNDCWPAISWSGIDYSGQWKALHYFAAEDFKNILISPIINNDTLGVYVVSDSLSSFNAELHLK